MIATAASPEVSPQPLGFDRLPANRRAMIDSQLRTSGINQPWVLAAFARVAREDFLPAAARSHAYIDRAVPLGDGHAMPAPLAQAMLIAEAAPGISDRALLIDCGAGYLEAVLAPLVGSLTRIAAADLASLGGNGYSLIVIEGAIAALPPALLSALGENGRVVTGLVERGVTRLASGYKQGDAVVLAARAEVGMPVLPEFAATPRWSF